MLTPLEAALAPFLDDEGFELVRHTSYLEEEDDDDDVDEEGHQLGLPPDVSPVRLFGPPKGHVLSNRIQRLQTALESRGTSQSPAPGVQTGAMAHHESRAPSSVRPTVTY